MGQFRHHRGTTPIAQNCGKTLMVATTCEIGFTGYTVLGLDANAFQKDFTALQQVDAWTWPRQPQY